MYFILLLGIFGVICINFLVQSTWSEEAHYYTIYTGEHTWNDARETCRNGGSQLLLIQNETEWNMWIELLNISYSKEHRSSNGIYWFGLHAPDTGSPTLYYWDNCTVPAYLEPAVDDYPITDYVCVTMWVRREVFNLAFMDMWLKGRMCSETHSFICMTDNDGCVPTCDEIIISTDVVTCDILCDGTLCDSTYFQQLNLCHVMPTTYNDPDKFYLCQLPSADYIPPTCIASPDVPAISATDVNMNVTDTICIDFYTDTTTTTTSTTTSSATTTTTTAASTTKASTTTATSTTASTTKASTTTDATNTASNNTITNTTEVPVDCTCLCNQLWTFLARVPPEEVNLTIEEKVEKIVEELTVDKKNTTVTLRKYVSVMDGRPSSVGIGIVAGVIIFSIFGIIVLFDLSTIWHEIHHVLMNVFKFLRPNSIMHHEPLSELAEAIGAVPYAMATGGRFKKFPTVNSNPPFIITAEGRIQTVPKPDKTVTSAKNPAFVWTAGGRLKAYASNPPKLEKPNANFQPANGLGWLMRERRVYNDMELPAYPNNVVQAKVTPGNPPTNTRL